MLAKSILVGVVLDLSLLYAQDIVLRNSSGMDSGSKKDVSGALTTLLSSPKSIPKAKTHQKYVKGHKIKEESNISVPSG